MVKNSLCVFFILSAYTENMRKVFKHLWRLENARKVSERIRRIRGKYLSVYGEHGKLGLFAVHKIVSEYAESI